MSTPPPGGPQTPPPPYQQTPPQYPQQYPPNYPPQQPYYGQPVTPPPKKSNTALIIVLVVVVVVVVLAVLAWYAVTVIMRPITSNQITVTGVSWTINYPGAIHYFGNSPLTSCSNCPITITFPTYQFQTTLSLTNSDSVAHNVTGVTVSGITFNLVGANPDPSAAPIVVNPGATAAIVLTIQASPFSGSYTLSGTITTT